MCGRMRMVLHLLALEGILTAAQLLDADQCGVGYQYRSPPEEVSCRANTPIHINCLVAFPSITPINTSVEVRWYWRSLADAADGSNTAIQVNDSLFLTVNTACNRDEICPDVMNNLTVNISQLEIGSFSSTYEGDYMCRILVINKTSGELLQALHPSACVRLQLASTINQNCAVMNKRTAWSCADTDQQTEDCPQLFSQYPVTPPPSSVAQKSSSASVIHPFQSTMSLYEDNTVGSPPVSSSAVTSLIGHITRTPPTTTRSGTPTGQDTVSTTLYVSVSLGALVIAIIGVVSIAVIIIIIGIRHVKKGTQSNTSNGRAPTFVLEEKSSPVNGEAVHNDGPTNEYISGSRKEVKRISSIYSKPVWVTEQSKVDPENNKYANPVSPDKEEQRGSGVYSYPYMHPPQGSKGADGTQNRSNGYQKLGDGDYMHMYSKPSPLLVSRATQPTSEEEEYEQMILNRETPSVPHPYTEPLQGLAKSN